MQCSSQNAAQIPVLHKDMQNVDWEPSGGDSGLHNLDNSQGLESFTPLKTDSEGVLWPSPRSSVGPCSPPSVCPPPFALSHFLFLQLSQLSVYCCHGTLCPTSSSNWLEGKGRVIQQKCTLTDYQKERRFRITPCPLGSRRWVPSCKFGFEVAMSNSAILTWS